MPYHKYQVIKLLILALISVTVFTKPVSAQSLSQTVNYDYTYSPTIKSVQFHRSEMRFGFPILYLAGNQSLMLEFDDLEEGFTYYRYKVVQCDRVWQPSGLNEMEYLNGINEQEIRQYASSVNTRQGYTHYSCYVPGDNVSITKSGNYLVHVYRESDDEVILTKRFVVSEQSIDFSAELMNQGSFDKNTEQYISGKVELKGNIPDPYSQLSMSVLQNGNWNSEIIISPRMVIGNSVQFNHPDKPVFKGLKEFRAVDLRSMRRPPYMIENLERYDDHTDVFLRTDGPRDKKLNISFPDLNGNFITENADRMNDEFSIDYILTHFYLKTPQLGYPVYILGSFNNWGHGVDIKPMEYNASLGRYEQALLLKQGYYDYMYAELNNNTFDYSHTEGASYETANNYECLLYYRKFGDRYDRMVGYIEIGLPVSGQALEER